MEDEYDIPVYFDFRFKANSKYLLDKQSKEFENIHPNLTLLDTTYHKKRIPVFTGPILFTDDFQEYREVKYHYTIYSYHSYYEPSEALLKWLVMMDECSEWWQHRAEYKAQDEERARRLEAFLSGIKKIEYKKHKKAKIGGINNE